jgi:hypothetical protein
MRKARFIVEWSETARRTSITIGGALPLSFPSRNPKRKEHSMLDFLRIKEVYQKLSGLMNYGYILRQAMQQCTETEMQAIEKMLIRAEEIQKG